MIFKKHGFLVEFHYGIGILKDGKGGFQDPGRRGRRRPEEPCSEPC